MVASRQSDHIRARRRPGLDRRRPAHHRHHHPGRRPCRTGQRRVHGQAGRTGRSRHPHRTRRRTRRRSMGCTRPDRPHRTPRPRPGPADRLDSTTPRPNRRRDRHQRPCRDTGDADPPDAPGPHHRRKPRFEPGGSRPDQRRGPRLRHTAGDQRRHPGRAHAGRHHRTRRLASPGRPGRRAATRADRIQGSPGHRSAGGSGPR